VTNVVWREMVQVFKWHEGEGTLSIDKIKAQKANGAFFSLATKSSGIQAKRRVHVWSRNESAIYLHTVLLEEKREHDSCTKGPQHPFSILPQPRNNTPAEDQLCKNLPF
jgi:hypothetical protein